MLIYLVIVKFNFYNSNNINSKVNFIHHQTKLKTYRIKFIYILLFKNYIFKIVLKSIKLFQ